MKIALFVFLMLPSAPAQDAGPKYFLEKIEYLPGYCGSRESVQKHMVKKYGVPEERFTERREEADYIFRIAGDGAIVDQPPIGHERKDPRWTLFYNDHGKEMKIASKKINVCWNAEKDLINAANKDWEARTKP